MLANFHISKSLPSCLQLLQQWASSELAVNFISFEKRSSEVSYVHGNFEKYMITTRERERERERLSFWMAITSSGITIAELRYTPSICMWGIRQAGGLCRCDMPESCLDIFWPSCLHLFFNFFSFLYSEEKLFHLFLLTTLLVGWGRKGFFSPCLEKEKKHPLSSSLSSSPFSSPFGACSFNLDWYFRGLNLLLFPRWKIFHNTTKRASFSSHANIRSIDYVGLAF